MVLVCLDSSSEEAATASSPHRPRSNYVRAPKGDLQPLNTEVNDRASTQHPQSRNRRIRAKQSAPHRQHAARCNQCCSAQCSAASLASGIL